MSSCPAAQGQVQRHPAQGELQQSFLISITTDNSEAQQCPYAAETGQRASENVTVSAWLPASGMQKGLGDAVRGLSLETS